MITPLLTIAIARYFILFTNVQIDLGFVVANLVPMILVLIFTDNHLRIVWRLALGLGVLPPLSLFYLRLKLQEPEEFNRETMKNTRTPWRLVIQYVTSFPSLRIIQTDYLSDFFPPRRPQVLLVPTDDCVPDLVHLRLLRLFFQHLFLRLASTDLREKRTIVEDFCMEYPHQRLLSTWRRGWSVFE